MEKNILACYATVLAVSDKSIYLKPDHSKKVIWAVAGDGTSLLRRSYVDPETEPYVGQYVGVVSSPNPEHRLKLDVYDANSPIFQALVADELEEIEEKSQTSGAMKR